MAMSMTGFGRSITSKDGTRVQVEMRSVNHRYLDLNLKLNHYLYSFENKIRRLIQERVSRGKLDVSISLFMEQGEGENLCFNESLASLYVDCISKISSEFSLQNDLSATRLANMRDVISLEEGEVDYDALWGVVEPTVKEAISALIDQRKAEGEHLKADLLEKLDEISSHVDFIEEKGPVIIEEYKKRITEEIKGLLDTGAETQRIAAEVVLFADRVCIDEEIVRLKAHVNSFKDVLKSEGEVGRKLDFIAQEMNRESNTILSKTSDYEISKTGIELKTLIEKVREQIQNLE